MRSYLCPYIYPYMYVTGRARRGCAQGPRRRAACCLPCCLPRLPFAVLVCDDVTCVYDDVTCVYDDVTC